MSRIILVDLSSVAHPIWHVSGSDPDPDHVSTASVARVRQLASRYDHAVVCCDSRKSFRRELSPEYKAQREERPEALYFQIDRAKEILSSDGYPVLESSGFEADDVIATCVRLLSPVEDVEELVVASSDKDLAQLVRGVDDDGRLPAVRVLSLASNELRGVIEVRAKFGVGPALLGDWLALVGDASDNIKGAPGIGDKKAAALLTQFGSLTGIYGALEGSTPEAWAERFNGSPMGRLIGGPAVFTALKSSGAQVALARRLVELRTDVPITLAQVLEKREPAPLEEGFDGFDAEPQPTTEVQTMTQQIVDQQTGEVTEQRVQVRVEAAPAPATETNGKSEFGRLLAAPSTFERALEPTSTESAFKVAGHLFQSKMFSKFPTPDTVFGAILQGRELGLGAMGSLRGMQIIDGKYSISADLLVALVLRSDLCEYFEPVEQSAMRSTWRCKRRGRAEQRYTFELADADRAKLTKKDSGWEKHPTRMCSARAKAFLARDIFPDIAFGLYTTEELDGAE